MPPADLALSFYASPKETKDTPLVYLDKACIIHLSFGPIFSAPAVSVAVERSCGSCVLVSTDWKAGGPC